jgi:hypothetical protein
MAVVAVQSLWRSSGFVESEQEGKNLERQYTLRAPGSPPMALIRIIPPSSGWADVNHSEGESWGVCACSAHLRAVTEFVLLRDPVEGPGALPHKNLGAEERRSSSQA